MSEKIDDILMFKNHAIRFWEHKAHITEQAYKRECLARKALEEELEKYRQIPKEALDKLILETKEAELVNLKNEANQYVTKIGIFTWIKILKEDSSISDLDTRIQFWKRINSVYKKPEEILSE
jgi:hypothetical protein